MSDQSTTTTYDRDRNQQILAWANSNRYEVPDRGRLSPK
ncbi:Lsr2 family DNA-binding protein [Amycolatopsis sp. NPDC004378]